MSVEDVTSVRARPGLLVYVLSLVSIWDFHMCRTLLVVLIILSSSIAVQSEDERFLVRVDTTGYTDSDAPCPKSKVISSIEVLASPNEEFHCRSRIGQQSIVMSGRLVHQDGRFRVKILHSRSVDTGFVVAGQPRLNRTESQTTVVMSPGESVLIGKMTRESDPPSIRSMEKHVLFLSKHEPIESK